MNPYVTGATVKRLRERQNMTQAALAEKLHICDKTVSKWETGKGYPDITLLEPIAQAFGISVMELMSGNTIRNMNVSANMKRVKFYVCPVCGNVIQSTGEAVITCHGVTLSPCEAETPDAGHALTVEQVEDEYYLRVEHEMTREHYISFIAAVDIDRVELVKLYPEGPAEARVKSRGVERIYYYCNRDGLFCRDVGRKAGARRSEI